MKTYSQLSVLVLALFHLAGCGMSFPVSTPELAPKNVKVRSTPIPEVERELPPGCAHDCEQGRPNCLTLSETALAEYPGELSRIYKFASSLKNGIEQDMTLGRNGKLRIGLEQSAFKALASTIAPTKSFTVRRVESDIPKLELLPNQEVPVWVMDDSELAKEWFGPLRTIEVLENRLVFDFSGNCFAFQSSKKK